MNRKTYRMHFLLISLLIVIPIDAQDTLANTTKRLQRLKTRATHELHEFISCIKSDRNCDAARSAIYKTVGALLAAIATGAIYYGAKSKRQQPPAAQPQGPRKPASPVLSPAMPPVVAPQNPARQLPSSVDVRNLTDMQKQQKLQELETEYFRAARVINEKISNAWEDKEKDTLVIWRDQAAMHYQTAQEAADLDRKIKFMELTIRVINNRLNQPRD